MRQAKSKLHDQDMANYERSDGSLRYSRRFCATTDFTPIEEIPETERLEDETSDRPKQTCVTSPFLSVKEHPIAEKSEH